MIAKIASLRNFLTKNYGTAKIWFKNKAGSITKDEIIKKFKNSKSYIKHWGKTAVVEKASSTPQNVNPDMFKIIKSKWGKRTMVAGVSLLAYSTANSIISRSVSKPELPRSYSEGYDVLDSTLTDYGSPLHLAKTASKVINNYKSTVRKCIKTTTGTKIASNPALSLSKNAIGHHRY